MSLVNQLMKSKGTCTVFVCTFLTLLYLIQRLNTINISKDLAQIETLTVNYSTINRLIHSNNDSFKQISGQVERNKIFLSNKTLPGDDLTRASSNTHGRDVYLNRFSNESVSNSTHKLNSDKIKIGILIPSSTRKLKNPILEKLTLTTVCLSSIYSTIESIYEYVIYIGIDKGDYLESVVEKIEMFDRVKAVVSSSRTFTKSVNAIARKAFQDGMDYLVRINDDSSFETKHWTSQGIKILRNFSPPNIGVVGPTCHQGNTAILTHDMVHRTHLEIFDFYYPPYFDNWWADDWITKVYSPDRSTKLPTWVVKHHTGTQGRRYSVDFKKEARLEKVLSYDKDRLNDFISNL